MPDPPAPTVPKRPQVDRTDAGHAGGRTDVVKGTLDLLILAVLDHEPMHGWGITQRIEAISRQVLAINQGSLYPALARLGRKGLIANEWRTTENNRRARYYHLTDAGQRQLAIERGDWERSRSAIDRILGWQPVAS